MPVLLAMIVHIFLLNDYCQRSSAIGSHQVVDFSEGRNEQIIVLAVGLDKIVRCGSVTSGRRSRRVASDESGGVIHGKFVQQCEIHIEHASTILSRD